jgi:serine/threonine protein kinase
MSSLYPARSTVQLGGYNQPDGTLLPNTRITVNNHMVTIVRYLAEGGFAHIYYAMLATGQAVVLKRLLCEDNVTLKILIQEAETHKKISGNLNIVSFIDYSYSRNSKEGFEMFIIMEYCSGGGLVDYLNTRLDNRPSESEVLLIFSDICLGVAHLHSMNPPIAHRDIKIENILLGSGKYKVCDFGSCTTRHFAPNSMNLNEIRTMEQEIDKYTTLQYRSPEMCDMFQKKGLCEKVDIWAMGVLLYKLCYYVLFMIFNSRLRRSN